MSPPMVPAPVPLVNSPVPPAFAARVPAAPHGNRACGRQGVGLRERNRSTRDRGAAAVGVRSGEDQLTVSGRRQCTGARAVRQRAAQGDRLRRT